MRLEPCDLTNLRPLLEEVVRQTLAQVDADRGRLNGTAARIAYGEQEASRLLGLAPTTLRDLRLAGRIHGTKIGKRTIYSRDELLRLVAEGPADPQQSGRRKKK